MIFCQIKPMLGSFIKDLIFWMWFIHNLNIRKMIILLLLFDCDSNTQHHQSYFISTSILWGFMKFTVYLVEYCTILVYPKLICNLTRYCNNTKSIHCTSILLTQFRSLVGSLPNMADVYIKLVEGSSTFSFLIGRYNKFT